MTGPYLLTGASGWFGRTALHAYEQAHGPEALRREVIPFASRERWVEFGSRQGPVLARPLAAITEVPDPAGLLHLAFLTRDKVAELGLEAYVASNRAITATVGQLLHAWPAMPVVTTSSGAAAALDGQPPDLDGNPYASLKQEEEALLEREAASRMAVVFRVFAASGQFMTRPQKFALGDVLLQAMAGEAIRIRAPHRVTRSYVSVESLMALSWQLLQQPDAPGCLQRIDACTDTLTLEELAQLVGDETGAAVISPEILSGAVHDNYQGDLTRFRTLLSRRQLQPLTMAEQIRLTLRGLRAETEYGHGIRAPLSPPVPRARSGGLGGIRGELANVFERPDEAP